MSIPEQTTVLLPAFNEALAIRRVVGELASVAAWREYLVVDAGSNDGTAERAAAAGARVIRHPYNIGNGAAVKTGIRNAAGANILIMDADGQHRPADALRVLGRLHDYDLAIAARSPRSQASWTR